MTQNQTIDIKTESTAKLYQRFHQVVKARDLHNSNAEQANKMALIIDAELTKRSEEEIKNQVKVLEANEGVLLGDTVQVPKAVKDIPVK